MPDRLSQQVSVADRKMSLRNVWLRRLTSSSRGRPLALHVRRGRNVVNIGRFE
jgi:hypothetical protein